MKKIQLKSGDAIFYRQFLEIIRSVPPINKLRPKEVLLLSEIMKENDKYRSLGDVRWTVIFSTENRRIIGDRLDICEQSFNNALSSLRKNKVVVNGNRLNQFLDSITYSNGFSLEFKFVE